MGKVELYVSCHKPFYVPKHPLLCPIQVGAALANEHFEGFLHDDQGKNISDKNRSYCELTAQYYAWKHSNADCLGFFHYRRYLYPDIAEKRPYIVEKEPALALLKKLNFDRLEKLAEQYDLIAPKDEDMHISVREHYANAPYHIAEDLALIEQIVSEKAPEYIPAMGKYFSQSKMYFGNIYIMRRERFEDYCSWLFPILEEFDCRADFINRNAQQLRADGYLAERLFGVYLSKHHTELRVLKLPRVHFEPDDTKRRKQQLINAVLPPGSEEGENSKHGGQIPVETDKKLRQLQLCELEILKELVRICEEHSLQYYLVGGTLLGAVRHKGFIPWDDDIDVAMPREDYERFAQICPTELGGDYFYQSPNTDLHYFLSYAKIRKNGTEIYEERFANAKLHKGVFIDIFPLDSCPKPGMICHLLFNILAVMNYRGQVDSGEEYRPYAELSGKIGYALLRLFSPRKLVQLRKRLLSLSHKLGNGHWLASYSGAYGYRKEVFPERWFDDGTDTLFESSTYKAPSEWAHILTQLFGKNYMQPPPVNERCVHIKNFTINENFKGRERKK